MENEKTDHQKTVEAQYLASENTQKKKEHLDN